MDITSSLWTEAGADAEAEAADARLTRAKVAAAGVWPFLAISQSEPEFDHRLALADEALQRVVEPEMVGPVRAALRKDFRAMRAVAAEKPFPGAAEPFGSEGDEDGDDKKEASRTAANVGADPDRHILPPLRSHGQDRPGSLQATAEYFDQGQQRWVKIAAPPGDGQPELGPNTNQTGFPPLATDPVNPINQQYPMQPSPWPLSGIAPTEVTNAATGEQVPVLQPSKGVRRRLPFAEAQGGADPFGADNPFAGGAGFAAPTPQTTPPRQIPGGDTAGGFDTGQGIGGVTDTSPSDEASKQRQVGGQPQTMASNKFHESDGGKNEATTERCVQHLKDKGHDEESAIRICKDRHKKKSGVVRERPTNDNPNGLADEYVSNNYDTPLKMAPRQSPEDRGINSPQLADDTPIPEASSDIPRPGDDEQSEATEKNTRVKQGFSARQNGPAMGIPVICLTCKRTGSVERVTAALQCVCGSDDLDLWDAEPVRPTATLSPETTFLDFMRTALVDPPGPNSMGNGRPDPLPCPNCKGTGSDIQDGGICRYCNGAGKVVPYGAQEPAPAVAPHQGSKTAAPRGKRPKQNGEFDVEQLIRDTTRGYGDRKPENETVRPGTKRKDTMMGVTPAYRPHFDYNATAPKKPFETGHRCPSCGHGTTYLAPDYKGDSWLTCPTEGPLLNVDRGAGLQFDPENPPEGWMPSARSFKPPPEKTAGARKKPKALFIAESVLTTNPGMSGLAAYRIAQRTVARFPGVMAS